ncbi:MAG: hypothetical protein A2Z91_00735 [Deltaproteobacteria bacterium GWA2_38_16]|nr:MAG: hypothetical protein A2Z91_00735 [Deltaproteobacteria bacterium GWA2_38_16]OGQ03625.1 MAG: hypothetical protein A3D19_02140 [Deltaproteobacteria bacterium RIFCSPHIGHO2_02_FULL_38_15]OGQ35039.1 MAG: hypothetical protein A3A72_07995 [Deltaproteobacteria bacterium RIFCSPLOWO2_01_FULL_38_9]OGQ61320.1 MAG: hypothetical protein A3G92_02965 [Deltaproteobacteria bacterium RIFCSPLOWO2_12_FULL_38_8]HBQ21129.1 hypothetical protein [Deltaproteobacteria bacterium]
MTCVFCTKTFNMSQGEKTCNKCAFFGGCQKVKCPYCGYESPKTPSFNNPFKGLKKWKEFLELK